MVLGSSSYAYSIIGRPLNYYYELNYDRNNEPKLTKTKRFKMCFKNINNKIPKKHIPKYKTKKRYLHNTENKAPTTMQEYLSISKDVKRTDIKVPEPVFDKDAKIITLPDPNLRIAKYNNPPGTSDINLNDLVANGTVNSVGVLSPDHSKIVYSTANYYASEDSVTCEMYLINLPNSGSINDKLKSANIIQRERTPLIAPEDSQIISTQFRTFVLLDWSSDSKKIAVKEKLGSVRDGIWQTNLIVYDFETNQQHKLKAVREAVRYWWKTNKNIDLIDYMWDIYPIGWDANSPDRIIVYAYAYTTKNPQFLGTWSVDYKGIRSELLSIDKTDFPISTNGLSLKMVVRE